MPDDPGAGGESDRDADGDHASADDPDVDTGDGPSDAGGTGRAEGDPAVMQTALAAVRHEVRKAAAVYAVVDAAAAFLVANLLLAVLAPDRVPDLAVPSAVADAVGAPGATVPGSAVVAAAVGLLVGGGEFASRVREPAVEQFEAANPPLAEALRTARDAVEAGADTRMARRLYGEVLAGLQESSSLGLVDARRVGATLTVVLVVSLLTVQAAVLDVALVGPAAPATNDSGPGGDANYTGLRDGDEVLGAPGEVATGNETGTARVEATGGGQSETNATFPGVAGGDTGGADDGSVDSQQAGFTDPEAVEEADLVREYNRRIRENDDATTPTGDDE